MQPIEKELLDTKANIFDSFEEKRRIRENELNICKMMRNEDIKNFFLLFSSLN